MKNQILNDEQIRQKLHRIAYQICEDHLGQEEIVIAGIEKRGAILSAHLADIIQKAGYVNTLHCSVTIDKDNPADCDVECSIDLKELENKSLIIVDDVLNSGVTLMHVVRHFLSFPTKRISVMTLVNRLHRRYPIRADYVGLSLATTLKEHISFEVAEDGTFAAFLE